MALEELNFSFIPNEPLETMPKSWSHTGVVGSGDMEVLLEQRDQDGLVTCKVITPVKGFGHIWEKVLQKFVSESHISNLHIEINDNNATPFIVATRLKQALMEAKEAE